MKIIADERPWLDPVRGHDFRLLFGKFISRLSGKPSLIRCRYADSDLLFPEKPNRMPRPPRTSSRPRWPSPPEPGPAPGYRPESLDVLSGKGRW